MFSKYALAVTAVAFVFVATAQADAQNFSPTAAFAQQKPKPVKTRGPGGPACSTYCQKYKTPYEVNLCRTQIGKCDPSK
jgi:hypothetical protein